MGGIIREEVIGKARLLLGDCRDILPSLERVDLVCTDPPYGIGEHGGKFRARLGQRINVLPKKDWDGSRPDSDVFQMILEKGRDCIIWGGNYFADFLPASKGWLYWRKLMGGDFADGELAWTSRDKALREFTHCPKGQANEHPTQKPLQVMRWCLDFFPDAETILDPFLGSGTTGVIAIQRGKSFVGIELDPDYFEIAVRRIREANGDDAGPLFGEAA